MGCAYKEEGSGESDQQRKSADDWRIVVRETRVRLANVDGCQRIAVPEDKVAAPSHPVEHNEDSKRHPLPVIPTYACDHNSASSLQSEEHKNRIVVELMQWGDEYSETYEAEHACRLHHAPAVTLPPTARHQREQYAAQRARQPCVAIANFKPNGMQATSFEALSSCSKALRTDATNLR